MTDDELITLRTRVYKYAIRRFNAQEAEDIANDSVRYAIEHKLESYITRNIVVEMCRERWGRADSPNIEARKNLFFGNRGDFDENTTSIKSPLEELVCEESYEKVREFLEPIQRCIVTLFVKYGLTHKEIADAFGHHETWVGQQLKTVGRSAKRRKIIPTRE